MTTIAPSSIPVSQRFDYVPEWDDFLALFPHRGSYLWATHPKPGDRPEWHTESRHLLSDRLIKQGAFLYGVRFGKLTHYLMLDIDCKSQYHPYRDPYAIPNLLEALEPIGLFSYVAVTSSYSRGLHLYFPFPSGITSWKIAHAAQALLQSKGFNCDRGHLELFPNARRCDGADYNGHRLPLQHGSYLVNCEFAESYTTHELFVERWRFAEHKNSVSETQCEVILKQYKRAAPRRIGIEAQKFLSDLNAEIEPGWSGFGQTNRILGRIAMREYIFHHVIHGGEPLTGINLAWQILKVAMALPGYRDWCRHQHEIHHLADLWARSVELSDYYPYKGDETKIKLSQPKPMSEWNQMQAHDARNRIERAVHRLMEEGKLPNTTRDRILLLRAEAKCSADTLYKHRDLWHPQTLKPAPEAVIHPTQAEITTTDMPQTRSASLDPPYRANKLYARPASNPPDSEAGDSSDPAVGGSGGFSTAPNGVELVKRVLEQVKRRRHQPQPDLPNPDEHWFEQLWLTQGGQTHASG